MLLIMVLILGQNLFGCISAENHIKAHQEDTDFDKKFPTTKEAMLTHTFKGGKSKWQFD